MTASGHPPPRRRSLGLHTSPPHEIRKLRRYASGIAGRAEGGKGGKEGGGRAAWCAACGGRQGRWAYPPGWRIPRFRSAPATADVVWRRQRQWWGRRRRPGAWARRASRQTRLWGVGATWDELTGRRARGGEPAAPGVRRTSLLPAVGGRLDSLPRHAEPGGPPIGARYRGGEHGPAPPPGDQLSMTPTAPPLPVEAPPVRPPPLVGGSPAPLPLAAAAHTGLPILAPHAHAAVAPTPPLLSAGRSSRPTPPPAASGGEGRAGRGRRR